MSKVVGIVAGRKYQNYFNWLSEVSDIEVIKLSHEDDNLMELQKLDGMVLCGGEDVHPRFYGKGEYVSKFGLDDIDEKRDEFEWQAMSYAQKNRLPLLGICRGLQAANAFLGGTLVPDLVSFNKTDHTKNEGVDRYHAVNVVKGSQLHSITGSLGGTVNSAHHQAADTPAEGLIANALSPDGVIEGLEWKDPKNHPYLMLVQWHPERMSDPKNIFAVKLRDSFLNGIKTRSK
jgi:putative glutamine amidotransferase